MFLIGVLDALVLPNLRPHIGQQRHGVSLRLQCLMHIPPLKKPIDHFPPGGGSVAADAFMDNEVMQFRQHIGLIEPGMIAVGEFLVGKVNGPAYQTRHAVRRSRDIQRRGQQRQQVDQKRLVRGQGLAAPQRRVKGIDGIVRRHPEPVIGGKVFFPFGQVFFQERDKAGGRRPHVHDGQPGQTGQSGLCDKGKIEGVEEDRFTASHRSYPQINPRGLFGGIGRERHDFAVLSAEQKASFFPRRSRTQRPHADGLLKRRGCDRGRTGRHQAGQCRGNAEQRVAQSFGNIRSAPTLYGFGEFRDTPPEQ